ncbi:reverse transcriptase [Plakobranchus ocellatus]|uniref:Reverse transcriptase n=1 Tax=Plakobranchus ocellatus TaxID=259542 RepID=A0AAV4D3X4_9GAST|nr:reverse transcriptase [Plakobranchus ocellatus]
MAGLEPATEGSLQISWRTHKPLCHRHPIIGRRMRSKRRKRGRGGGAEGEEEQEDEEEEEEEEEKEKQEEEEVMMKKTMRKVNQWSQYLYKIRQGFAQISCKRMSSNARLGTGGDIGSDGGVMREKIERGEEIREWRKKKEEETIEQNVKREKEWQEKEDEEEKEKKTGSLPLSISSMMSPRVLNKIQTDKATGVLIVPFWPAQRFYPVLMKMLIDKPVLLSARQTLLQLPGNPSMLHPLHEKLRLLVCKVSGTPTKAEDYLIQQPTYLFHCGDQKPKRHGTEQDTDRQSNRRPHCSILASSNVLFHPYENVDRQASASVIETDHLTAAGKPEHASPSSREMEVVGTQSIRHAYKSRGLSDTATNLLMSLWRPKTKKTYEQYITKWQSSRANNKLILFHYL